MNVNRNLENNKSGAWILRSFSYSTNRFILIESATYWSYHLFRKTYWSLYPGCSISCTFWYLILTKPKKIHSVCVIMVAQTKGQMLHYLQLSLQPKQINLTINHFHLKETVCWLAILLCLHRSQCKKELHSNDVSKISNKLRLRH